MTLNLPVARGGYGRGDRQKIETDRAEILTGVWHGTTIGSPIALLVPNRDYKIEQMDELERPRPGHGDLSGSVKYHGSIRGILERSSARETAARVAAGALARQVCLPLGIRAIGYVSEIGPLKLTPEPDVFEKNSFAELLAMRESSCVYSLNPELDDDARKAIDDCQTDGDTLGGVIEVRVDGLPFGLGTHAQWDEKFDGRIAQAVMAVQAIKGVEIGLGFEAARRRGSEVHDPILFDPEKAGDNTLGFARPTNNAGGLEAGMTNGQPLIVRAAMKPIATLATPLESINLKTRQPESASYERSDVCAISAASVVIENVVAFEVARAVTDKFGSDHIDEIVARWKLFEKTVRERKF